MDQLPGIVKSIAAVGAFADACRSVFLFALQDPQYRVFYATGAGQLLLGVVIGLMAWGYRYLGRAMEEVG